jgi:hypothetical protein
MKNEKPEKPKDESASSQDKLIQAALKSHLLDYADRKKSRKYNIEEVLSTTREFMDTFVVIGYDYDGDPISCISAATQQEQDALFTLVNKFMMQHLGT